MNSNVFKILFIVLALICFNSCGKKQDSNFKIKNLYIETVNFTPELKSCFDSHFFNEHNTDTTWFLPDIIIYHYKDAISLPDDNLLDYTKKMKITLLEKDSVGNPFFAVETFRSEESKWIRTGNSSRNSVYSDTLLNMEQLCKHIIDRTHIYILKFNP